MSADKTREASISTRLLTRIIVLLIGAWTAVEATVLIAFEGASAAALGAGLEDVAAKRLLGAHLLLLAALFFLISLRFESYHRLIWLPFGAQALASLTVGYAILNGDSEFGDSIIAVVVSGILAALLGFVWMSEQRTLARERFEADEEAQSDGQRATAPGEQA